MVYFILMFYHFFKHHIFNIIPGVTKKLWFKHTFSSEFVFVVCFSNSIKYFHNVFYITYSSPGWASTFVTYSNKKLFSKLENYFFKNYLIEFYLIFISTKKTMGKNALLMSNMIQHEYNINNLVLKFVSKYKKFKIVFN